MDTKRWIVTSWREDGRYHARDAQFSKWYRSEKRAQLAADKGNAELPFLNLVVRSYYYTDGVIFSDKGKVSLC